MIESGNYRMAKVISIDGSKVIVKCILDNIILLITKTKCSIDNISVGDICQIFRTSLTSCLLIEYQKTEKEKAEN